MKKITETLRAEHRLIGRAAACLDRLADEALETDDLRIVSAIKLLEFFDDYVDRSHQEKEERYLFPALLDQGLGGHRVRELMRDHGDEREVLRNMRLNLEGAAYGDPASREEFVRSALQYATLEREHAGEEDEILLPLVEEYLSVENEDEILEGFRRVESRVLPNPPEHYARLVEDVSAHLGSTVWEEDSAPLDPLA